MRRLAQQDRIFDLDGAESASRLIVPLFVPLICGASSLTLMVASRYPGTDTTMDGMRLSISGTFTQNCPPETPKLPGTRRTCSALQRIVIGDGLAAVIERDQVGAHRQVGATNLLA